MMQAKTPCIMQHERSLSGNHHAPDEYELEVKHTSVEDAPSDAGDGLKAGRRLRSPLRSIYFHGACKQAVAWAP